ncbi:YfbM family protein [Streptomyces sp. NBC_00075]|uniref:hypothetical protein n=1 Tax=Streptomyces sp. NBC_00075 TaxID=2975641 RepID=UPI0032487A35
MNVSLFPLSTEEVLSGFDWVISRFQDLESDASEVICDLGEDGGVVESFFARIGASDVAALAVSGGALLGDDDFGTACTFLTAGQVKEVNEFLSSISVREVMGVAPDVLNGVIRGGIPDGYLDDLETSLIDFWKVYELAARGDMCVAQICEG